MDEIDIKKIINNRIELFNSTMNQLKSAPYERKSIIRENLRTNCYRLYVLLREIDDPSFSEWLKKMVEYYENSLDDQRANGKWYDIQAFNRLLEAAFTLKYTNLLNNLVEWCKDPYLKNGKLNFAIRRMLLNVAIIENNTDDIRKYLENIQKMSSYDSYTKVVFNNVKEVYEAILSRDREVFEGEISEMKKRWKRTKEGRKYSHCRPEIIYRGLFDIYMEHETPEELMGD